MESVVDCQLSKRECEVLHQILKGLSNKNIARILHVSERTVKFHCSNIYNKLNVVNRYELLSLLARRVCI